MQFGELKRREFITLLGRAAVCDGSSKHKTEHYRPVRLGGLVSRINEPNAIIFSLLYKGLARPVATEPRPCRLQGCFQRTTTKIRNYIARQCF